MTLPGIGIDIGGTKIAAGLVKATGEVLRRTQAPTPASLGRQEILGEVIRIIRELAGEGSVSAIGVGTGGVIDPASGRVTSSTGLLTDWAGTDIAQHLEETFAVDVTVMNDAHAHAAGEAMFGAGIDRETVMMIAVGTGIGGAIVRKGVPVQGAHGAAGHLGHVASHQARGLRCSCGRMGHVEAIASGPGLLGLYKRIGGKNDITDARDVVLRIDKDLVARRSVELSATALGEAIGGLVNVLDPDVVVIAGGLQHAGDLWWHSVRSGMESAVLPSLSGMRIVPATLGENAAVIGAACVALKPKGGKC